MSIEVCKRCCSLIDTDFHAEDISKGVCINCQDFSFIFKVTFNDFMFLVQAEDIQGATLGAKRFIQKNYDSNDDFQVELADMPTILEFKSSFPGLIVNESGTYSS